MRVLVTASTFPVRPDDGVRRFVYDLAQALAEHAEVLVLAPDAPGARRDERLGRLRIRRLTYFRPRRLQRLALAGGMLDNLGRSWLARFQVPGFFVAQAIATRGLIRRAEPDVVNAHWMIPQGLTAAWAIGNRKRVPVVLQVHAGDVYLLKRLPLGRTVARYIMARTDMVLAAGSHVRDTLDELLGYPSGAVIQPMGVDLTTFGSSGETPGAPPPDLRLPRRSSGGFLLFFGRLVEKKGVIYLLRALTRVLHDHPDLGLVVIGDGLERSPLERESARLGLQDSVRFLGRLPQGEIASYLRRCRAAVVPSIIDRHGETEGMPTVVLEAMAAGVRVVASAVDGIPDVVRHGENGWLCREKDAEDLAEKILIALQDPPASPIVREALRTAREHDWQGVASRYLSCFQRLMRNSDE